MIGCSLERQGFLTLIVLISLPNIVVSLRLWFVPTLS